ncbi:4-alpha-glucanotransferase DPE2 [Pelomyxa schiedti]|nr:4-alpha-glucanotransferase DPE2 [Pelomyxa schiedti]
MCFAHSPMWTCELEMNPSQNLALDYQVGIIDPKTKSDFVCATEKRRLRVNPKENSLILYVLPMFRPDSPWKGSGVAIPVFSLRSRESTGVGEFLDLIKFIDWARSVGFQLIQLLPINDTISNKKWTDSYPYSSISVHALNPIFLNLQNMGSLDDSLKMKRFAELREHLNGFEFVNWDQVMHAKLTYARLLFNQLGYRALSKSKEFQEFFVTNKFWLTPYAAFSCLRDRFGTAEFSLWPEFHTYNEEEISRFSDDPRNSTEVSFYYFLQYHLHRQMQYVADYARHSGVVLKGDLPIGVSRNSVDAWTEPQYFNMNYATGAPPDFFAPNGQNWAFPTYNWERMREDGFIWWKRRLASMEKYFDAFRIDHILGFFRIWEIPAHAVTGMLGQFTPTIPLHANELRASGLHLDCERLCRPYIREHFLGEHVGNENVPYVKQTFLVQTAPGCYSFKPEFDTQRKVKDFCDIQKVLRPQEIEKINQIMNGLFILSEQVCLLERPGSNQTEFSPRYALRQSSNRQPPNRSFLELDWNQQRILEHLSTHYFYHRQHDHWAEKAAIKLPPLKAATRMLICGEDLGDHVPAVVGKQMRALDMLSLSIERMPKNQEATFANPDEVPYLSVVSTSSHDVPTLRGWFRSEMATGSRTLRDIWKHMKECHHVTEELEGSDMSAIIAERFISHHLASPAMWAIFPLQDILALDETIRLADPDMEQINNPPNPNHMWRFRFHIATDDLLCASALNNKLMGLSLNNRNTYQHNNHH